MRYLSLACGTTKPDDAIKLFSRSHDAVIRVYDDAGNVIETHEHKGDFKGGEVFTRIASYFSLFFDASGKLTVC
jgi:hypothetical protein